MRREHRPPRSLLRPAPPADARKRRRSGHAGVLWFAGGGLLGLVGGVALGLLLAAPPLPTPSLDASGVASRDLARASPPSDTGAHGEGPRMVEADPPAAIPPLPPLPVPPTGLSAGPSRSIAGPGTARGQAVTPPGPDRAIAPPASPRAPQVAAAPVAPRIVIHHRAGAAEQAARAIAAALQPEGAAAGPDAPPPRIELRAVQAVPSQRVVRYFRGQDAAAAARLAGRLGRGWVVQDFRFYDSPPLTPLLEIWLPEG